MRARTPRARSAWVVATLASAVLHAWPEGPRLARAELADDSPADPTELKPVLTLDRTGTVAELSELVVEADKPVSAASSQTIRARDFQLRPHTTMLEVLNNVPGLVVAQHQGGGKAAQYFLRGFDSDHGTDVALYFNDVPVNLVSHAHGQGYADLNFIIPETIDRVRLFKGPYFPQLGDFANAGALEIVPKAEFRENFALAEGGSFDTQRYVVGLSPKLDAVKILAAGQIYATNGPFLNPQNYFGANGIVTATVEPDATSELALTGDVYQADWDASGEIPLRAVKDGQLDRFGSIDPTEGGRTDRQDLMLHYDKAFTPTDRLWSVAYVSRYKLKLYSDFTFNKNTGLRFYRGADGRLVDTGDQPFDPSLDVDYVPSDMLEQNDSRYYYGLRSRFTHAQDVMGFPTETQLGVETRNDQIDLGLYRSVQRNRFYTKNKVAIEERSASGYWQESVILTDWLRFTGGLRGDWFFYRVSNRLPVQADDPNFEATVISGTRSTGIVSPKANLIATPLPDWDVYTNFGTGFHSNDARVAILAPQLSPLTRSIGAELGSRVRILDGRMDLAAALWWMDLDSEIVFSGDGGDVDAEVTNPEDGPVPGDDILLFVPGDATRRWGIDFELRHRWTDWLTLDFDLSYADPRFRSSGLAVPLAPTLLMNGGLTLQIVEGLTAGLRGRFLANRPATEDRSLTASGYFLLDLNARYRWRNVELGLALENLTGADWREAQFADQSCLASEIDRGAGNAPPSASIPCVPRPGQQGARQFEPADDIHFTPGDPFGAKGSITIFF